MKKIVSLVLALSMVLSMFATAFAGTALKDVAETDYEAAVSALVELGIVAGYEDGTYQPNKVVTRAEMAKLLVISAGLEPAADVAKGATNFSDVAANHWASGYINVASQYGYINGYPSGTFAPDATVTYAEAVTMAIRVLGYKSVVEAKGTWPTNYIAKAQELKVLDDVDYKSYSEGATRGNVALLIWNMLRTAMWDVESENESNGLTYSDRYGTTMIDKYFEDYLYIDEDDEAVVTAIEVEDGKVEITLDSESDLASVQNRVDGDYELAKGVEFLNLYGRHVSVLYNKEDEVAVMVIPSADDKVVEGYTVDLVEDDYTFDDSSTLIWGPATEITEQDNFYEVAVLDKKKVVEYSTAYDMSATYIVDELDEIKEAIEVTAIDGTQVVVDEDAIVIIDGEFATCEDIKVGDVITILDYVANGDEGDLFVVARERATGDLKEVTYEEDIEDGVYFIKVGSKNYENVNVAVVVEVDDDENETETELDAIMEDDESKFYDEEATLFLNFLGEVERIEFAEIEDKENESKFYVLTNIPATWDVTNKDGVTSYVELNGESYEMKSTVSGDTVAEDDYSRVVMVKFDNKDRVKEIVFVEELEEAFGGYEFDVAMSGDGEKDVIDDNNYLVGGEDTHKVTSNTVVYTITPVKDEDDEELVDHYEVTSSKGTAALKGVEYAFVAIDEEDSFGKAAYVFVWEDAKNTEKTFGIVDKYTYSNGKTYLTIDGTKYEVAEDEEVSNSMVGSLVAFVEDDDEITISLEYTIAELEAGVEAEVVAVVEKVEDELISTSIRTIDLKAEEEDYEDHKVFFVTVSKNRSTGEYTFKTAEEITWSDISVKKDDIIVETDADADVDAIVIIRGYKG